MIQRRPETDYGKADSAINGTIVPPGVWLDISIERFATPQAVLFMDRDGVIVKDPGYLSKPADVRLVKGAVRLMAAAETANLPIVVITNQAGIARGYFDWDVFASVQKEITRRLDREGVGWSAVVACPFHPKFTDEYERLFDGWRKPGPKMFRLAAERLNIDLARSAMVGDQLTDMSAAEAAGLAGGVLVLTGEGTAGAESICRRSEPNFRVAIVKNPAAAIEPLRKFGLQI